MPEILLFFVSNRLLLIVIAFHAQDHVESQRIVRVKWLREDTVVLFFNSGTVTYINIDVCSGDIVSLGFDRFSKDKLLSLHISDSKYYV